MRLSSGSLDVLASSSLLGDGSLNRTPSCFFIMVAICESFRREVKRLLRRRMDCVMGSSSSGSGGGGMDGRGGGEISRFGFSRTSGVSATAAIVLSGWLLDEVVELTAGVGGGADGTDVFDLAPSSPPLSFLRIVSAEVVFTAVLFSPALFPVPENGSDSDFRLSPSSRFAAPPVTL